MLSLNTSNYYENTKIINLKKLTNVIYVRKNSYLTNSLMNTEDNITFYIEKYDEFEKQSSKRKLDKAVSVIEELDNMYRNNMQIYSYKMRQNFILTLM